MKLTIFVTIVKLLSRPTVGNGMVWSLSVHTTAVAATVAWFMWLLAVQPASISQDQQVIQLQVTMSHRQATDTVEPIEIAVDIPEPIAAEMLVPQHSDAIRQRDAVDPSQLQPSTELVARPVEGRKHVEPVDAPRIAPPPPAAIPRATTERSLATAAATVPEVQGYNDQRADMTGNLPPVYPAVAIRRRLEGTVLLQLQVADTGHVERVAIVRSSGHAVLDQAAVAAVRTWRGNPATRFGRPVASDETLPVRFRL